MPRALSRTAFLHAGMGLNDATTKARRIIYAAAHITFAYLCLLNHKMNASVHPRGMLTGDLSTLCLVSVLQRDLRRTAHLVKTDLCSEWLLGTLS